MKDEIVIASAMNGQIRIHAARTTDTVEAARAAHTCMPTSAAALGRVLTVTAIMASDLKNDDEKIIAMLNGNGPAGTIIAQADSRGNVRGLISDPNLYIVREDGHLDVGAAVGTDGMLSVTRDMALREPFTGSVKLQTGEIGEDFAYYFTLSEQTPSAVGVGVLVAPDSHIQAAGGLIYQLLPGASEEAIEKCEQVLRTQKPVSQLIDEGHSPREIIQMYFEDAVIMDARDVRWHCGCTREYYRAALQTLSEKDLQEMIDDGKGAEVRCQYCGSLYSFTPEELEAVMEEKRAGNRNAEA